MISSAKYSTHCTDSCYSAMRLNKSIFLAANRHHCKRCKECN